MLFSSVCSFSDFKTTILFTFSTCSYFLWIQCGHIFDCKLIITKINVYTTNINRKRSVSECDSQETPQLWFLLLCWNETPHFSRPGAPFACVNANQSLTSICDEIIPLVGSWGPSKRLCWAVPKGDWLWTVMQALAYLWEKIQIWITNLCFILWR